MKNAPIRILYPFRRPFTKNIPPTRVVLFLVEMEGKNFLPKAKGSSERAKSGLLHIPLYYDHKKFLSKIKKYCNGKMSML